MRMIVRISIEIARLLYGLWFAVRLAVAIQGNDSAPPGLAEGELAADPPRAEETKTDFVRRQTWELTR